MITNRSIIKSVYLRKEYFVGFDYLNYINEPIIYSGWLMVIFVKDGTGYKVRRTEVFNFYKC